MRCSCRKCGTYMIQEEYGLRSGCRCPACGEMCHDCMGSAQEPLDKEALAAMFAFGMAGTDENEAKIEETPQDSLGTDWRKYL
ncbi:MAG: hypothetical protein PHC80_06965 [Eubacteriales bacterium]|nr:hypothetical protein [Eubacteriales bacterium]